MKVLHLLTSGETGGIESLCRDIGRYGQFEHTFCFVTHGGAVCEQMKREGMKTLDLEKYGSRLSLRKLYIIRKTASDSDAVWFVSNAGRESCEKTYQIEEKKQGNL